MASRGTVRFLAFAGAIGIAIGVGRAQEVPVIAPAASLPTLVKNLDSPEATVRIDATEAIFQSSSTLKEIEAVLAGPLSPEQRQRLLAIAERRFRSEPRAAMGIRHDGSFGSHGVTLDFLQPEFPAAQVLKLGDRIIAAGGSAIDTWDTMRPFIISHDPGDQVPITIVREGATLTLTVALGDFTRLRQPSALDPSIMADAWSMRSRGLDDPKARGLGPIESGLSPLAWAVQYTPIPGDAPDNGVVVVRQADNGEPLAVVAGGEPRGGVEVPIIPPMGQRNFNLRGGPRQNRFNPGPIVAPQDPALALQQQIQAWRSILQDRRGQIDALNQRLTDPSLTPAQRQSVRTQIDAISASVQVLTEQIRRLDQQLNPRHIR